MNYIEKFNLDVSQKTAFDKYLELLQEWNNKINLTAITEKEEIELKHFYDSLTISDYIKPNSTLIDVGTGAGFPGIPLKIKDESIKLTLLDSLNKRLLFLEEVEKELKLDNVENVHGRAEDIGQDKKYREKYDYATSRAVARLSVLVEYLLPFVKVGGYCICMKGPNIEDELKDAEKAIKVLGGEIEKIDNFKLENDDNERNIVIIKKIKNTPKQYPRKAGTPTKEPIA